MYRPSDAVLREFVLESNAIEGYTAASVSERFGLMYEASPFFESHMQACRLVLDYVSCDHLPAMRGVHSQLMHGVADVDPASITHDQVGALRQCEVTVGGEKTPRAYTLPRLVEAWEHAQLYALTAATRLDAHQRADVCYQFHLWFECIHPFRDGNGRLGRLLWNGMRLRCGLDWATVYSAERHLYYEQITRWRRTKWESLMYNSLQKHEDKLVIEPGI